MNQAERDFIALHPNAKIVYPTKEQDMFEHWDIEIDGVKIDVKGRKKINRRDGGVQDEFHFLEIKNVRGDLGWAYGKSDAIAFETKDCWILVRTAVVQQLIKDLTLKEWVNTPGESLNKLYRRPGRKDIITMVKVSDLKSVAYMIIK